MSRLVLPVLLILTTAMDSIVHAQSAGEPDARVENMSHGQVEFKVTVSPAKVRFDRDTLVVFRVSAASELTVEIPPLDDRLEGFVLSGSFDTEPGERRGKTTWERHARLSPTVSSTYRIAPMAIKVTDRSRNPIAVEWFATRPVTLEAVSPVDGAAGNEIKPVIEPVWIHPPFRTVALWFLAGLAVVALVAAALWGLKQLHREVVLRRMSPRERAMRELERLLRMDLVKQDKIKEFYLELTMIVRRYIERRHDIRAPEQTTEEFLVAVRDDSRFSDTVVDKLRTFLEAADLVKFAAHRPDNEAVSAATTTATRYIDTDDAAAGDMNEG
ncbi:MAG: hypothetical protein QGI24_04880 [Kiritimatiellia bacterium]|jgi:hypothetical protein|nr:hypothetical protein [Kiritimatiellia bacterium]MDP6848102.1 hypothetical protein [Kiritimatiellia bacterium]